jgi:hypothetical protein
MQVMRVEILVIKREKGKRNLRYVDLNLRIQGVGLISSPLAWFRIADLIKKAINLRIARKGGDLFMQSW